MGRRWLRLAFGVAVLATPVAAWWLIGDLSESGLGADNRDYAVRAPDIAGWIVATAGAVAFLAALVSLAALARGVSRQQVDRRWFNVLALLMFAGVFVAYSGRVATAGVGGANIGYGLCIIFGGPILAALILGAVGLSISIRRRPASSP